MAFATSSVVRESGGSENVLKGTWTATVGDAAGTVTIGGYVTDARFIDNASSGPYQNVPVNISNSSGTGTVTVYHAGTVTDGKFEVRFK